VRVGGVEEGKEGERAVEGGVRVGGVEEGKEGEEGMEKGQ
jgi:hypothetical protein